MQLATAAENRPSTQILAVQIPVFEGRDYAEVQNELDRLKNAGVDTIILRVFHNRGDRFYPFIALPKAQAGVYFKSTESPVVEDILGPLLSIAHKRGLKVFAWMTTRYADYGLEGRTDLACKAYDFSTKEIVPCKGLDLFHEDAVRHLERLFDDLAGYPVDGILLQDDLVLRHNEGFGPYSEALFERDYRRRLMPDELYTNGDNRYTEEFWRWAAWKNKRLLHVATRLKTVVKKRNPDAKFAINLMYEAVSNPTCALAWLSQSLGEAVKLGFDYYAIMAYHRQMQDELKKEPHEIQGIIERMVSEAVKSIGEPNRVLMKLQTIDWNTSEPLPDQDVVRLFKRVKEIDNVSLAVMPYRKGFPFEELGSYGKVSKLLR